MELCLIATIASIRCLSFFSFQVVAFYSSSRPSIYVVSSPIHQLFCRSGDTLSCNLFPFNPFLFYSFLSANRSCQNWSPPCFFACDIATHGSLRSRVLLCLFPFILLPLRTLLAYCVSSNLFTGISTSRNILTHVKTLLPKLYILESSSWNNPNHHIPKHCTPIDYKST